MTSDGKGVENAQMDEIATEQVNARLAWFLAGAYAGGAKRKRIARDFEVSPDTAKGWLNGAGPGRRHFDAMVKKWGPAFLRFVYPVSSAQHHSEMSEIAERLARLEAHFETLDSGGATGLASAQINGIRAPGSGDLGRQGGWPADRPGASVESTPAQTESQPLGETIPEIRREVEP